MCSLDYVTRAGYSDDGREVTVLALHDDGSDRHDVMIPEIIDRGTEIEDELHDRMINSLAIQDGSDVPADIFRGCKAVYERDARGRTKGPSGSGSRASTAGAPTSGSLQDTPIWTAAK